MSEVFGDDFPVAREQMENATLDAALKAVEAVGRELNVQRQTAQRLSRTRANDRATMEYLKQELAGARRTILQLQQEQARVSRVETLVDGGGAAGREIERLKAHLQTSELNLQNAERELVRDRETAAERTHTAERELDDQRQTAQRLSRDNAALRHSLVATRTALAATRTALRASNENATVLGKQVGQLAAQLNQAEAKANAIAAEARGDRQARNQLVQAVRVAIREAVPDA